MIVAAISGVVIACGPSFRTVVEGDMRFEHCYRIDEDPQTPVDQKRACWHDWTARYTKGQDRSRVKYAKDRIHVLEGAPTSAYAAPSVSASGSVIASPSPSSPYVPPPSTVASTVPSVSGEKSAVAPTKVQVCTEACNKDWRTCIAPCYGMQSCVAGCEGPFRSCVKTCL